MLASIYSGGKPGLLRSIVNVVIVVKNMFHINST